jgi:hypothetical protein
MTPTYTLILIGSISFVVAAVIGVLATLTLKYRTKYMQSQKARLENMEVDLELATSDQLWEQLRQRPKQDYILLRPDFTKQGQVALQMEVHNIPPIPATGILKVAAEMHMKQLSMTTHGREFLERIDRLKAEGTDSLPPWLMPPPGEDGEVDQ